MPEALRWRTGEPPLPRPSYREPEVIMFPVPSEWSGSLGDRGAEKERSKAKTGSLGAEVLGMIFGPSPWHYTAFSPDPHHREKPEGSSRMLSSAVHTWEVQFFQACKWWQAILSLFIYLLFHSAGFAPFQRPYILFCFLLSQVGSNTSILIPFFYRGGNKAKQINKENMNQMPGIMYTIFILIYLF